MFDSGDAHGDVPDGFESLEAGRRVVIRRHRSPTNRKAPACSIHRAPPDVPRASCRRCPTLRPKRHAGERGDARDVGHRPGHRVPVAGAALSHVAVELLHGSATLRRHRGRDGAMGSRSSAARHRALPRDHRAVRSDDVRAHVEAARSTFVARTTSRRSTTCCTPPRRARWRSSSRCSTGGARSSTRPTPRRRTPGTRAIGPDEWLAHRGSVGKAQWGVIHIVDDDGIECPPGEPGDIYFENPVVDLRVPQGSGQERGIAAPRRLVERRRRRLRRRRGLPLPHRPQVAHDHLRRRQHLSARNREPAHHSSRRCSTSRSSACPITISANR